MSSILHELFMRSATRVAIVASLGLFGCAQQNTLHGCQPSHRAPPRPCPSISIEVPRSPAPKPTPVGAPIRIEVDRHQEVVAPKPNTPTSESVLVPTQQKPVKFRLGAVNSAIRSGSPAIRDAGNDES